MTGAATRHARYSIALGAACCSGAAALPLVHLFVGVDKAACWRTYSPLALPCALAPYLLAAIAGVVALARARGRVQSVASQLWRATVATALSYWFVAAAGVSTPDPLLASTLAGGRTSPLALWIVVAGGSAAVAMLMWPRGRDTWPTLLVRFAVAGLVWAGFWYRVAPGPGAALFGIGSVLVAGGALAWRASERTAPRKLATGIASGHKKE